MSISYRILNPHVVKYCLRTIGSDMNSVVLRDPMLEALMLSEANATLLVVQKKRAPVARRYSSDASQNYRSAAEIYHDQSNVVGFAVPRLNVTTVNSQSWSIYENRIERSGKAA